MKVTGKVTKTEGLLLAMAAVFLCVLLQLRLSAPEPVEAAGCVITTSRAAEEPVTPEPTPPVDVNTAGVRNFHPDDTISRAEISAIVWRIEHYAAEA